MKNKPKQGRKTFSLETSLNMSIEKVEATCDATEEILRSNSKNYDLNKDTLDAAIKECPELKAEMDEEQEANLRSGEISAMVTQIEQEKSIRQIIAYAKENNWSIEQAFASAYVFHQIIDQLKREAGLEAFKRQFSGALSEMKQHLMDDDDD